MIIQANAVSRQSQCGNGIQKACRQPSQSAVSQGRLRLHFLNGGQFFPVPLQHFFHFIINPKVYQIVGQQFPNQELHG